MTDNIPSTYTMAGSEPDVPPAVNVIGDDPSPRQSAEVMPGQTASRPSSNKSSPLDSEAARREARHELWTPRRYHIWKSPLIMVTFFILGLGFSGCHCARYTTLENTIVGSSTEQENNLRVGTACAFLAQIALATSCWQVYTQWIWRSVKRTPMSLGALNAVFGVDTSVLSFLNLEMLGKFKVGTSIAFFAWTLILPPFFTPGTLFIVPSTNKITYEAAVPYLTIANSSEGHLYSYSPAITGDRYGRKVITSRVFTGPRTVLTLLSTATAARGEILPIKPPANRSSYSLRFYGPAVQCLPAEPDVQAKITQLLEIRMNANVGSIRELKNAYYGFVPSIDAQNNVTPLSEVRYQSSVKGSNELWMVFQRYVDLTNSTCDIKQHFQVCKLWNATFDIDLSWDNGFQKVTGSPTLMHEVAYPNDGLNDVSNMAQHAYSAFMWVLSEQAVGSFGWFNDTAARNGSGQVFGMITSPIQHNSLLGSSDLDVFFDFNEVAGACQSAFEEQSPQRQQDISLAKNRTLGALIEELSFNMTVSLMHNDLLMMRAETRTRTLTLRMVEEIEDVNIYGYSWKGLFIPYALACLFSFVIVMIGVATFLTEGVLPAKKFQDVLSAAEDADTIRLAQESEPEPRRLSVPGRHQSMARRPSLGVDVQENKFTFRVRKANP